MYVKDLKQLLAKCDENDEITFIFDENKSFSWDRGDGLKEVTQVNVTGYKINGKIALTNGLTYKLLKGDEPSIFTNQGGE